MVSPRQSPAEIQAVHPAWHWLTAGLAGAALLVLTAWSGGWAYHHAKVWRARQLAGQASDFLEKHDKAQAQGKLMAAYNLAPFDPEVLRACGHDMAVAGDPHALGFYHILLLLPQATRADRREAASACLTFGDVVTAKELTESLVAKDGGADDFALQARVLWQQHDAKRAISTMRHALALAPENRVTQLLLGEMLALSVTPENLTEATNLLEKVAGTSDAESLQALVLLARNRNLDEKAMRDVLRRLRAHPLLDDNGRMAAWELEKRLTPYEGKAILGRAADSFKPTGVARRAVAARWLYDLGEPALALELAHAPDAAGNQDLFKVREDALANLGQWAEVKKELDDPAAPLPPYLIWLYRARCAAQLGSPAESDADWERARDEGSHQPGALAKMADYSLQLGFYAEARKTLARMAQSPTEAKMGYIALLQLEASHGATTDLLATLRQMTIDFPMEPEPRNDWAYLSLLLNQNVEKATQTAQSLVRDHPQFLAYRSTLALACLRHNDPQAAAQAYAALQVDWEGCPASWKMIYATVLAAQGKQTEGLTFVHDVRAEQLRPAELAFFKTYFPGT